jgi:hypothetical protein
MIEPGYSLPRGSATNHAQDTNGSISAIVYAINDAIAVTIIQSPDSLYAK